jgi:hypothetical protein
MICSGLRIHWQNHWQVWLHFGFGFRSKPKWSSPTSTPLRVHCQRHTFRQPKAEHAALFRFQGLRRGLGQAFFMRVAAADPHRRQDFA